MKRQSNHRSRNDSPRIVGTYAERIRVLQFTKRVWELLPHLHPELNFDHEAFAHITVGFLREKGQSRLMGLCSLQILNVETLSSTVNAMAFIESSFNVVSYLSLIHI